MDATGLGLATAGLCIKYGKELYAVCQNYRNAEQEIRESILEVEGVWLKTQSQLETIRNIWSSLDERVQIHQNHVLMLLYEKLQHAVIVINGLDSLAGEESSMKDLMRSKKGELKRIKYAVFAKKKLEGVVRELKSWQKMYDPSWYLLVRIAPSTTDQEASREPTKISQELFVIQELRRAHQRNEEPLRSRSSVFLSSQCLDAERKHISHTSTQIGYAAKDTVIINSLHIQPGNDIQLATKDARNIARILANVDPTIFGLLTCRGVIQVRDHPADVTGFEFIFSIPAGLTEPQSLRTFLLSTNHRYSLDGRFRLARLLARSISFLHSAQIVHKNITPETVLLLKDPQAEIHTPFLVGFEKFRHAEGRTYMSGDTMWEKNLYRHPQRQGERPEEEYKMQHDIYSLGVVLLELGLNISFVYHNSTLINDLNPKGAWPNPTLDISEYLANKDVRARASQIKQKFVSIAEDRLPGVMGKVYTNVVISCLTCLDKDIPGFGDVNDFTDEDGILVGVRYIEKILYQFEEIKF